MRTLALDIGDVWTGTAISDALGITSRPYKTLTTPTLITDLAAIIVLEKVSTLVIGLPITMRGTHSDQTNKVLVVKDEIAATFPTIKIVMWDERMTSKQASHIKRGTIKTKEDKIAAHSIAAAVFLSSYLMSR
jgi:putative Holliday junction resolvase